MALPAHQAEVIGFDNRPFVGETDSESTCLFKVFGSFVLGKADDNLLGVKLPGPGGRLRRCLLKESLTKRITWPEDWLKPLLFVNLNSETKEHAI
jgi:hypothetical protein